MLIDWKMRLLCLLREALSKGVSLIYVRSCNLVA